MDEYIATFQELSNWHKVPYQSTTGTRAKRIYVDPKTEMEHFFKCSKELNDGTFRYPLEFWSEIASSKIGRYLGFNILDYNIGYAPLERQPVGCLSISMVDTPEDILTEGVEYLRGFNSKYDPIRDEKKYTLGFILNALNSFDLRNADLEIIEMLVFDALIGNSDRHQENWGFITKYKKTFDHLEEQISKNSQLLDRWKYRVAKMIAQSIHFSRKLDISKNKHSRRTTLISQSLIESSFSPIYDSGCSLGRELNEEKIQQLLNQRENIFRYIDKGRAEVRYETGKKPKQFELMKFLNNQYPDHFMNIQQRIRKKWNDEKIKGIIYNLDKELPITLKDHKLPDIRKELMFNLIALRKDILLNLG